MAENLRSMEIIRYGVETFIFDFDGDIYGKMIEVQLLEFDRGEQKFASLEELKERIETR